jgi:Cu/Ag efflux protein CusF
MTESFAELFEQSIASQRIRPGTILNGLIVEVGQDYVIVNVGLKSEAVIPSDQFKLKIKTRRLGSMNRLKIFASIATVLMVTVCLTAAPLQQAPERGGGGQAPPAAPPAAQAKTATGELSKVDVAKKEITIKGADSKDMVFVYSDATQLTGVEGGAQGLTGKTGATLRVTYMERGGANQAARIEVQEKK